MSSTQTGICLVVQYKSESLEEGLTATLNSIKALQLKEEEPKKPPTVLVWNSTGSELPLDRDRLQVKFPFFVLVDVEKDRSFFSDISSSLLTLEESISQPAIAVLHCEAGVVFKASFLSFLHDKCNEYDFYNGNVAFTAVGYKIFPHEKERESFQDGIHFKLYSELLSDRAVHLLTPPLCLLNVDTLHSLTEKGSGYQVQNSDHFWLSFMIASTLGGTIWKLNTNDHVSLLNLSQPNLLLQEQKFKMFYDTIYSLDWPIGISQPFYANESKATPTISSSVSDIWTRGFGGVNMSSEPASTLDFKAVASYGCKVIRIGAVADAKDLNYLLNPSSSTSHCEDNQHLNTVLPRLRQALIRISECGLKSIITMTDLPGDCMFQSKATSTFWVSAEARERAALFWGQLAKGLSDLSKDVIAGYDLINEPYEPVNPGYFDDITCKYAEELNHFYGMAHQAIRGHDDNVVIILSPLSFASPRAMKCLSPIPDSNVAYSFHMYAPPNLTLRSSIDSQCSYPGSVRRWPNCNHELIDVTFEFLYDLLKESVYKWQVENNVPSNRILVGEFGISREVKGAEVYLKDLLKIFTEFGWSWLLFSFRDDEWDALDYELGPDINNMLYRSPTELFLTVSEQFH